MSDKEIKEAVSCAIRHIGTGVYSSGKICFFLQNKGYDESVSIAAVKELVNTGYIDDQRASKKVLFTRSGKKQESRNYMLKRLIEAGIDPDIADDVVATLFLKPILARPMKTVLTGKRSSSSSLSSEDTE